MREKLATRLGFILLSAGCAIGLGNVWRFPYIAARNGGGWFLVLYLAFLAAIGIPVLMMEFALGRAGQRSIAGVHAALTPEKRVWRVHGIAGALGNTLLMMFYTVVTGWMALYFLKMASGTFDGLAPEAPGAVFGAMLADPVQQTVALLGVCLGAAGVCAIGLQKGVERITKWLMLGLLVLIVVLAVHSLLLPGAGEGVRFYLVPSLAKMRSVGIGRVVVEAMNQAFFTLSLGIGAMVIFGSYVGRDKTLFGEAIHVTVLDTCVAVAAGLIIIPAGFACAVLTPEMMTDPELAGKVSGPGLIFTVLPNVFREMHGGRFWGSLFFLFMSCAAFTTVLAVFENILACLCDYTGLNRRRACLVLALALPVLSLPCVLGFNVWSSFRPFGEGSCVLDLEDFVVSNLLLPLGGISFALYCSSRMGWGWERFRAEVNAGDGPRLPRVLRGYCAYVLPAVIAVIFVLGILEKFNLVKI